jgi:hypothetical protein
MPRCDFCKKKTHLEFKCTCSEKVFCVKCRTTEIHRCDIKFEKPKLEKVVREKVEKIT